ncbi:hypothetical protein UZ36_02215 [Candidatus Nitromaritima sp. SCGC AAA799-C22]|nr:hypothetical protein UZ36_02215 [Candidatus Nitromaritima sp. SCGC AAA799-C22]
MPSYVYACEACKTEIRHITSAPINTSFSDQCPTCKDIKRFKFVREGNVGEDWYSKILIKNKRRRPGDELYKTDEGREDGLEHETKISA